MAVPPRTSLPELHLCLLLNSAQSWQPARCICKQKRLPVMSSKNGLIGAVYLAGILVDSPIVPCPRPQTASAILDTPGHNV
jgi:hypothetical protein